MVATPPPQPSGAGASMPGPDPGREPGPDPTYLGSVPSVDLQPGMLVRLLRRGEVVTLTAVRESRSKFDDAGRPLIVVTWLHADTETHAVDRERNWEVVGISPHWPDEGKGEGVGVRPRWLAGVELEGQLPIEQRQVHLIHPTNGGVRCGTRRLMSLVSPHPAEAEKIRAAVDAAGRWLCRQCFRDVAGNSNGARTQEVCAVPETAPETVPAAQPVTGPTPVVDGPSGPSGPPTAPYPPPAPPTAPPRPQAGSLSSPAMAIAAHHLSDDEALPLQFVWEDAGAVDNLGRPRLVLGTFAAYARHWQTRLRDTEQPGRGRRKVHCPTTYNALEECDVEVRYHTGGEVELIARGSDDGARARVIIGVNGAVT